MNGDEAAAVRASKALAPLADLTPSSERTQQDMSVPLEWFRWLNHGLEILTSPPAPPASLPGVFGAAPGITPVVFGASERRAALAHRLSAGQLRPATPDETARARQGLVDAINERDRAARAARHALRPAWCRTPAGDELLAAARRDAPGAFDLADRSTVADLIDAATVTSASWWGRWRRRRAERRLRRRVGAAGDLPLDAVLTAFELAGPPAHSPGEAAAHLHAAEAGVRRGLTDWLAVSTRSPDRLDQMGMAAVATLATALRSGRSARRTQLERLRDKTLTKALPVWLGTLGDVDDLLPPVPALFDLVVVARRRSPSRRSPRRRSCEGVGSSSSAIRISFAMSRSSGTTRSQRCSIVIRSMTPIARSWTCDATACSTPRSRCRRSSTWTSTSGRRPT